MKKTLSLFLALLMLFASFSFAHAETSDEQSEHITFEDVLAGVATLEEYNATRTKADIIADPGASSGLANATYYFNNKSTGGFLKTNLKTQSGLLANLGSSIKWKVTKSGDYYTIRTDSNSEKYLGVPSANKASNEVILVTVNGTVPAHCRWTAYIDASGGCHLKSAFNYKYLYVNGSSIATSSSIGSGNEKDKRVWRAMTTSYYGNTASSTKRELSESSSIRNIEVAVGGNGFVIVNKGYSNELFTLADDFTYTLSNTKAFYSNGKVIGNSGAYGGTKITATHKVTGRKKIFYVLFGFSTSISSTPLPNSIANALKEPHDVWPAGSDSKYYQRSTMYRASALNDIYEGAIATIVGGWMLGHKLAKEMLSHYLSNSGTKKTIGFKSIIDSHADPRNNRIVDINYLMSAVEASAGSSYKTIRTIEAIRNRATAGTDFHYAINRYYTSITCTYRKNGNRYEASVVYELRDAYDWDRTIASMGNLPVSPQDMWELHHGGVAKNYEVYGCNRFNLSWTQGQTFENGAVISNES